MILVCCFREREMGKYCHGYRSENTTVLDELFGNLKKILCFKWGKYYFEWKYWKYHCSRRASQYLSDGSCVGVAEQVDWGKRPVDYHRDYEDHNQHHLSEKNSYLGYLRVKVLSVNCIYVSVCSSTLYIEALSQKHFWQNNHWNGYPSRDKGLDQL